MVSKSHQNSERGATMVENAIGLSLFLALIVAIVDLSLVLTRKAALLDIMRIAGQVGVTAGGGCEAEAIDRFQTEFNASQVLRSVTVQEVLAPITFVEAGGSSTELPGPAFLPVMNFRVRARIPCVIFCRMVLGRSEGDGINFDQGMSIIVEDQSDGCIPQP